MLVFSLSRPGQKPADTAKVSVSGGSGIVVAKVKCDNPKEDVDYTFNPLQFASRLRKCVDAARSEVDHIAASTPRRHELYLLDVILSKLDDETYQITEDPALRSSETTERTVSEVDRASCSKTLAKLADDLFSVQTRIVTSGFISDQTSTVETRACARAVGRTLRIELKQLHAAVVENKRTIGDPICVIC